MDHFCTVAHLEDSLRKIEKKMGKLIEREFRLTLFGSSLGTYITV